jgi:hypothetical protein
MEHIHPNIFNWNINDNLKDLFGKVLNYPQKEIERKMALPFLSLQITSLN